MMNSAAEKTESCLVGKAKKFSQAPSTYTKAYLEILKRAGQADPYSPHRSTTKEAELHI